MTCSTTGVGAGEGRTGEAGAAKTGSAAAAAALTLAAVATAAAFCCWSRDILTSMACASTSSCLSRKACTPRSTSFTAMSTLVNLQYRGRIDRMRQHECDTQQRVDEHTWDRYFDMCMGRHTFRQTQLHCENSRWLKYKASWEICVWSPNLYLRFIVMLWETCCCSEEANCLILCRVKHA